MELRSSHHLALILGGVHFGVSALMVVLPVALWLQWCGAALLLASAVFTIMHYALRRGRGAVTALHFDDRTQLRARTGDGVWHAGCILGTSTVGATLAVLNIQFDDRRQPVHVVISGDSMTAEDFRRLRVWLRWGPRPLTDVSAAP